MGAIAIRLHHRGLASGENSTTLSNDTNASSITVDAAHLAFLGRQRHISTSNINSYASMSTIENLLHLVLNAAKSIATSLELDHVLEDKGHKVLSLLFKS